MFEVTANGTNCHLAITGLLAGTWTSAFTEVTKGATRLRQPHDRYNINSCLRT